MKAFKYIRNFFILSFIILVIDYIYLGGITKDPFMKTVEKIQNKKGSVNYFYSAIVYLLIITGVHYFIIIEGRHPISAFILGTIIYGVFDFTNLAIFDDYPVGLALHDTIWGGTLFFFATIIFEYVENMLE